MGSYIGVLKVAAKRLNIIFDDYRQRCESGSKWCTKCKQWKVVNDFGKDGTRYDGLDATCFSCRHVKERVCTKGRSSYFKGHHHTEESKRLQSLAKKGHPSKRKGSKLTNEQRLNISNGTKAHAVKGADNPRWKGGISAESQKARYCFAMKEWRRQVFERDNFKCRQCGYGKGKILVAHHINPFSEYKNDRYNISNGITLCRPCHELIHWYFYYRPLLNFRNCHNSP